MKGFDEKGGDLPHFLGHRERLKARFRDGGADSLRDYELLELILFQVDPAPRHQAASPRRCSPASAVSPRCLPRRRPGSAKSTASANPSPSISRSSRPPPQRFARDAVTERPLLDSWSAVIDYCRAAMAYEPIEQFRILFLDKKNVLIADEVQQSAPSTTRRSIRARWSSGRSNFPPPPSSSCTTIRPATRPRRAPTSQMTKQLVDTAKPLGIAVHDHIIVGHNGHASFKGLS